MSDEEWWTGLDADVAALRLIRRLAASSGCGPTTGMWSSDPSAPSI